MEINGIAHVILTVRDFAKAHAFYSKLLPFLGMKIVADVPDYYLYGVGGRTAIGIRPADASMKSEKFNQERSGLHHFCIRAKDRASVDEMHTFLVEQLSELGAKIIHPPQEDGWAPGYYSVLFEDPDGIRLEMNFVPGKGLLTEQP
jgi:catechol 2,3-dioxygenase-like lactoylglutathione lyase family enzyme